MLVAHNINFTYPKQKKPTLHNISCSILPNRITTFIGHSGSGKSTLFCCFSGLITTYTGSITVHEKQLATYNGSQRASLIGMVTQSFDLFKHLTVLENCMQPQMVVQNKTQGHALQQSLQILTSLGMESYKSQYPDDLSGGQQQRIAIARALCLNPTVLLLDEPTASLDPSSTQTLANIIKQLALNGIAIGVSSHDQQFVHSIKDRMYLLEKGEIIAQEDLLNPLLNQNSDAIIQFLKTTP